MKKTTLRRIAMKTCCLLVTVLSPLYSGNLITPAAASLSFEEPVLITSIGQSADGQMVKTLAGRNNLNFTYDPLVREGSVSSYKTLLLVVGGSAKGLGAAGINADQEEQRAKDLITAAKNNNVKIIVSHVGGESRRGEMTDKFIRVTSPHANYMIVVADGDKDKLFANIAGGAIPIDYPNTIVEVGSYLKAAFNK